MKFVRISSYKCAYYLAGQNGEDHRKRGIYYYGFQIIIGGIVKISLLTGLATLFDIVVPTAVFLIYFASLRVLAGGYHMDSYGRCAIISIIMFMLAGALAKYGWRYLDTAFLAVLITVTFLLGLYVIIRWAPQGTHNNPITRPAKIRRLKKLSLFQNIVWLAVSIYFLINGYYMIVFAGCIGILLALFIISPAGYAFFDFISGKKNRKHDCSKAGIR
jgi:accessory gene regulator B